MGGDGQMTLAEQVREEFETAADKQAFIDDLRNLLHELSPQRGQPIDNIKWVPVEKVEANDYNPNSVACNEMRLLYTSIEHDGYTQPVVTVYDPERDRYVIVDGFHRFTVMQLHADIRERCNGLLPIVVIDKDINDRMASTVRHNRARGKHSVTGMASMVFQMLENGWSDDGICAELGLEADELLRLKHVTGFSKLFEDVEYRRAWETRDQIKLRIESDRIRNASRPAARRRQYGEQKSTLTEQYRRSCGHSLTQEEIDDRRREMQAHYRDVAEREAARIVDVTCPYCGGDFGIDRQTM